MSSSIAGSNEMMIILYNYTLYFGIAERKAAFDTFAKDCNV